MNNEDIHTLSGAYAVDAVDDMERARFEKHLTSCEACQTEVAELRAVGAALADLAEVAPPPELRGTVLAGISTVRPLPPPLAQPTAPMAQQESPADATKAPDEARREPAESRLGHGRPRPTRRRLLAAAAAVVALGGVGTLAVTQPWEEQARPTSVAQQVESASDAQRATATVGSATATVVRSASLDKAVLVTHDMPAVPSGKVYQAWLQAPDGTMTSAGLMGDGSSILLLHGAVGDAKGVGITVEPSGGSPQPTTTPVALISLT